jgi:anti-sigma-K factor RskA
MDLMRHPECADRVAAAYALGTLRGAARRRFETQARQSPGLRALALAWQGRFAAMTELQPEEKPSPDVWKRIELQLRQDNALARERARAPRRRWFASRPVRALAGVAAVLVVFAVALLFGLQLHEAGPVQYVAILQDTRSVPQMLVTFDTRTQTLTLKRVGNFHEAADRSLQLWALPASGAPRSLAVLDRSARMQLPLDQEQLKDVPTLAISLEPRGGAPQGSGPTGPVLLTGAWMPAT